VAQHKVIALDQQFSAEVRVHQVTHLLTFAIHNRSR
jgi:hypothetical protein